MTSFRAIFARHAGALVLLSCLEPAVPAAPAAPAATPDYGARIVKLLGQTPLIDGHNDLPWEIRLRFKDGIDGVDLSADTSRLPVPEGGAA